MALPYSDYRDLQRPVLLDIFKALPVDYISLGSANQLFDIKVNNIEALYVGLSTADRAVLQDLVARLKRLHGSRLQAHPPPAGSAVTGTVRADMSRKLHESVATAVTDVLRLQTKYEDAMKSFETAADLWDEYADTAVRRRSSTLITKDAAHKIKRKADTYKNGIGNIRSSMLKELQDKIQDERERETPPIPRRERTRVTDDAPLRPRESRPRHWFEIFTELKWTTDMILRLNELRSVFSVFESSKRNYVEPENAMLKAFRDSLALGLVSLYESRTGISGDRSNCYRFVRNMLDSLKAIRNRISHQYGRASTAFHEPGDDYDWFEECVPPLLGHLKAMLHEISRELYRRARWEMVHWHTGFVAREYRTAFLVLEANVTKAKNDDRKGDEEALTWRKPRAPGVENFRPEQETYYDLEYRHHSDGKVQPHKILHDKDEEHEEDDDDDGDAEAALANDVEWADQYLHGATPSAEPRPPTASTLPRTPTNPTLSGCTTDGSARGSRRSPARVIKDKLEVATHNFFDAFRGSSPEMEESPPPETPTPAAGAGTNLPKR